MHAEHCMLVAWLMFLPRFDVLCAHAGQIESICFMQCFHTSYPAQNEKCFLKSS